MIRKFEAKYSLVNVCLKAEGVRNNEVRFIMGMFDKPDMALVLAKTIVQRQWPLDSADQPVKSDEFDMPDQFYMVVEVGKEETYDFDDLEEQSHLVYMM